ncbi:chaperone modulator CbpM [Alkanindiges sp. WGS2144]|uniref:chaperone modulator CbpM n=1 Tax=Alkanindiges sp. WGS2144 TaxID=3366808 RepID=UPI003751A4F1
MRQLIIRDLVVDDELLDCTVVDANTCLSLGDFAHACGQPHEWVVALVEHSILEKHNSRPESWQFVGEELARARRAWRLQRDFDASLTAVALMLDLLDEVKQLRMQMALVEH